MDASKPVFNLITRTSGRPLYFDLCHESIISQTYPRDNIKKFVTFDTEADVTGYLQKYLGLVLLEMEREKRKNQYHFPYHMYLNEVLTHTDINIDKKSPGWIIILDDDNTFAKKEALGVLAQKIIENENDSKKFYIWKCQQADGVVPSTLNFDKKFKNGDLHISCFAFHSSQIPLIHFEPKVHAETDILNILNEKLTGVWIDDVLTRAPIAGNGLRKDYVPEPKKKITLKPAKNALPPVAPPAPTTAVVATTVTPPTNASITPAVTQASLKLTMTPKTPPKSTAPKTTKVSGIKVIELKDEDSDEDEDEDEDVEVIDDDDEEIDDEDEEVEHKKTLAKDTSKKSVHFEKVESDDEEEIKDEDDDANSDEEEITNTDLDTMAPVTPPVTPPGPASVSAPTPTPINPETMKLFNRLMDVLNTGRKIYILDENNMKQLSKCLYDSLTCIELEDKLIQVLEGKMVENKSTEVKSKLTKITGVTHTHIPSRSTETLAKKDSSVGTAGVVAPAGVAGESRESCVGSLIDKIYLITDDNSPKNSSLERNKKILGATKFDYEIVTCKEMKLQMYQNQIKEILLQAKKNNYGRVMILNGNDLLNTKFIGLFDSQVKQIATDCYLWFLGNTKETSPKEILTTKFDLNDYLYMYDDIVTAKYTTEEKAKKHWKSYGHMEARYAMIEAINSPSNPVNNNYGFIIASEIYDAAIEEITRQSGRDCKSFLIGLQKTHLEAKHVWVSRPDLIIPNFSNPSNSSKNQQIALRNGWYYNFYK